MPRNARCNGGKCVLLPLAVAELSKTKLPGSRYSNAPIVVESRSGLSLEKSLDPLKEKTKIIFTNYEPRTDGFEQAVLWDQVYAGAIAADGIASTIGIKGAPAGKVAILTPFIKDSSTEELLNGFENQLQRKYPTLVPMSFVHAGDSGKNFDALAKNVADTLRADPTIVGILPRRLI